MGKARLRKKLEGYRKQLVRHIAKFREAEERGDVGSMDYMAREMRDYIEKISIFESRLLPNKKRKKNRKN